MNRLNTESVLFEDNHLLVVNKPAGLLSMGDETQDPTIVDLASDYLKVKYNKPGNVFVGVVHRLDRPVSGVLVLARTSKAASRLSDQFRRNVVQKTYTAIVEGRPTPSENTLTNFLIKDHRTNTVSVVDASAGGKESILSYQVVSGSSQGHPGPVASSGSSVVAVYPKTGRSHQIRVQLAHAGHPIVGDTRYGSVAKTGGRIMLHATQIQLTHPTQKTLMSFEAPLPDVMHAG